MGVNHCRTITIIITTTTTTTTATTTTTTTTTTTSAEDTLVALVGKWSEPVAKRAL